MPPNADKKDEHGASHGEKKKSLPMRLVGISIAILAVLIFVYFAGATLPQVVHGSADLVRGTGQALTIFGGAERVFAAGFRAATSGFREAAIEFLVLILFVAIFGWVSKLLFEFAFYKKKTANADHH